VSAWRFGRGWSEDELQAQLAELQRRAVNFDTPASEMMRSRGWTVDGVDRQIGVEAPGPPTAGGLFERGTAALVNYDFSDPRIVVGHFDPHAPLQGRDMLLEIKVFGFRFLNGVRVSTVRDQADERRSTFGFRYDTLEGHIERGFEWFAISKNHESGQVRLRIEAHWRLGEFPSWWSRVGFLLVGERFRGLWRRLAVARLRRLARQPAEKATAPIGGMAHRGGSRPTRSTPEG
jgi:uncharacterized protein (UPF0548 family)